MKKTLSLLLALALCAGTAYAAKKDNFAKESARSADAPAAPKVSASDQAKREETKKKIEEKKKELNGSEWKVDMSTGGKSLGEDTFTFQNNQVTCKTLTDKGYPATNYTVSVPDGSDMAIWETMQTHPKQGVVFIRGEWKEGTMRGVMTEQIKEGESKDYQFASLSREAVAPTTEEAKKPEQSEAPPAAPETASESPSPAPASDEAELEAKVEVAPFNPGTTDEVQDRSPKAVQKRVVA